MSKDINTPKGLDMVDIGRIVADVLVAGSDTVALVVTVRAIRSFSFVRTILTSRAVSDVSTPFESRQTQKTSR